MADEKAKQKRTVKPVYAIMSIVDDAGQTLDVNRENVTVHEVVKSADDVLDMLEAGTVPKGAFYKRIALA